MYKLGAGNAAAPAASYHYETRVSDQSSRIIFSGTQDLGGGTRAWFQLDSRFQSDVGGSTQTNTAATTGINLWAGGNTGVGLAGDWGKLTIGRWDLHYLEFIPIEFGYAGSLQDLLGAGPMAQVNGSVIANGTRTPNVIMWDSANMGGVTARVAYSTAFTTNLTGVSSDEGSGKGANGSKGGALTAAVRYSRGPLGLGASYWTATPETGTPNPPGEQRSLRLWGGYTLPMGLKVGLGFDNSQRRVGASPANDGDAMTKRNAFMVPASYVFGSHTAFLTLVKVGKLSGPNAGGRNRFHRCHGVCPGLGICAVEARHVRRVLCQDRQQAERRLPILFYLGQRRNQPGRGRKRGAALHRLLVPLLKATSTDGARPGPFFCVDLPVAPPR